MDKLLAWLQSKNITSHSVAAVVVILATALTTDQQVRDFFISLFQAHPKVVTVVMSLAAIVLKYSHSSKQTGGTV